MNFRLKAVGGAKAMDRTEVLRALTLLMDRDQTFELRSLPSGRSRICHGQDLPAAVEAAWELSDEAGVYFTLNPLPPDQDRPGRDRDVLERRWLLIDVDSARSEKDSGATESEKARACDVAGRIFDHLNGSGWPSPLFVDSGNGWHLLYRVDLPNDKLAQQLIKSVLSSLGDRFDSDTAKIDRAVHNAARISKLPGSWARKGSDTPERPHRLSKIIYEPQSLEVVTVEQLQALVRPEEKPVELNGHSSFTKRATDSKGLESYCRSAVERECGRLCMTPEGNRDNQTNSSAFCLGTMAAWPEMDAPWAKQALYGAARQAGLDDASIRRAINSGWTAGKKEPRARPVESRLNGSVAKLLEPGEKLTIRASQVQSKKVDWLWSNVIAQNFITLFAGRTGVGKSFCMLWFAARLSKGLTEADGFMPRAPARTLVISEDPQEYMLKPRLHELGADMDMVEFMTWKALATYTLGNIEMLDKAYEDAGRPIFISIDPPTNFLGGKDEHKNAEVRQVLMGLVSWLNTKNVACVLITHINKSVGKGIDAIDRIIGSVAWGSTSRVAIAFIKDPDHLERCLMAGIKNNLGPVAKTLAYQIVKTDVLANFEWLGEVDTTADEAMNREKKKPNRKVRAIEWLIQRFRERLKWDSGELETQYRAGGH